MKYKTIGEYQREIARVDAAMKATDSVFLQRDYGKYKRRLENEMRRLLNEVQKQKGNR